MSSVNVVGDSARYVYICMEEFEGNESNHMNMNRNDLIKVTNQHNGGWWSGVNLTTNHHGWFPTHCVRPGKTKLNIKHKTCD